MLILRMVLHRTNEAVCIVALGTLVLTMPITVFASTEPRCAELNNVIKCEDFDDGDEGTWPHGAGSTWVGSSGSGPVWTNLDPGWTTGTTFSEIVSDTPCGPRGRTLHLRTVGPPGGGTGFTDTQRIDISPAVTQIRVRYNVCMDQNFDTGFSPTGVESGIHSLFLDTAYSGAGVRFDLYSYANGEAQGSTNTTITYGGSNYTIKHPWGPECGNSSGARGFFNVASPAGWPLVGNIFMAVDYNHGELPAGAESQTFAPNLCKNIHNVFFNAGTPRWVTVERAYKILPADTVFTCSTTCPTRLGLAQIIIDGTTVLNNWPIPPDPAYLTIGSVFFDQFVSTLQTDLDGYYDDIIVTADYDTIIGPVAGAADGMAPAAPTGLVIN